MKVFKSNIFWGAALVMVGILVLLENLGFMLLGSVWALLFAVGAAYFVTLYVNDHTNWWAWIPAGALGGIALTIGVDAWLPASISSWLAGSAFLACLGGAFLVIAVISRGEHWWAYIPGGILSTLALMVGLETGLKGMGGEMFVGLMFLGFAATFALVGTMPTRDGRQSWAFWPAGIMAAMGLIFSSIAASAINYVWPVVLIVAGAWVLLRNIRSQ